MFKKRIIARNIFSNWSGFFISALIAFFLSPFLVHNLGNSGYGLLTLIISITGYFGILDIGMRSAVGRFVARYLALGDKTNINRVINTNLFILLLAALVTFMISILISKYFINFFNIDKEFISIAKILIILIGLSISITLSLGLFNSVLAALERYDTINIITICSNLLRAVLIVIFIKIGKGLIAVGVITLAINLVDNSLRTFFAFRMYPDIKLSHYFINYKTFKENLSYGIYSFISVVAVNIIFYTDSIVIGKFLSMGMITYYAIAANLIEYVRNFVATAIGVFQPVSAKLDAHKNIIGLQKLLITGTKFSLLLILPIGLFLIFFGKQFITLWMGYEYAVLSSAVLIILTLPQFSAVSQYISGTILFGMAKHKILAYLVIGEAIANLIISIILVKKIGLIGVAWGTAIPLLVTSIFVVPLYVCKKIGLSFFIYIKNSFIEPLLCSIIVVTIYIIFRKVNLIISWKLLFIEGILTLLFFYAIAFFVCFNSNQRNKLSTIFNLGFKRMYIFKRLKIICQK
ncbi:MAG: oligosaccharide flippase family protein [Candidatus Omnitrophica bacterium]|jgi:O-antigen/teichoic acid export membrane protein|nr:oligosaccharide flippase family protein [Candidatus Omnitrophota bacterium]